MRRATNPSLLALLFLLACREAPREVVTQQHDTTPRRGGRIVRRLDADVSTLNYVLHTSEEERQVLAYLYDPLIALNEHLDPVPCIVTRWEIAEEGKVYTLHLDPRATFSDGSPVTATDVLFTIEKIVDEKAPQFSALFENLDRSRTTAIDARTVRVAFTVPRVTQLLAFTISVLPKHVYAAGRLDSHKEVVGTGPYVLKARESGRIEVERRRNYWRETPFIDTVVFRVIADDAVAWNALRLGEVDVSRVPNDSWWRGRETPDIRARYDFVTTWLLSYNCFAWNLDSPLFADTATRRALAMSFNRDAVIANLYHGQARPVTGPFTPDQWANDPSVPPLPYDPKAAAELLRSAGWRDSDGDGVLDRDGRALKFTLLISTSAVARDQSLLLQDALRRLGIRVEIATMDSAAFFDRVLKRNFEAAFFAWYLDPDPDPFALFHSSQIAPVGLNVGGYTNPAADSLMDRARTEFDRPRRAALYHELHRLIARDQPYLWTVQVASKWAVNRRVRGVQTSKGLGLFVWQPGPFAWWVAK